MEPENLLQWKVEKEKLNQELNLKFENKFNALEKELSILYEKIKKEMNLPSDQLKESYQKEKIIQMNAIKLNIQEYAIGKQFLLLKNEVQQISQAMIKNISSFELKRYDYVFPQLKHIQLHQKEENTIESIDPYVSA